MNHSWDDDTPIEETLEALHDKCAAKVPLLRPQQVLDALCVHATIARRSGRSSVCAGRRE